MNAGTVRYILLPGDKPLKTEEISPGMFVVIDNPYTVPVYFDSDEIKRPAKVESEQEAPRNAAKE